MTDTPGPVGMSPALARLRETTRPADSRRLNLNISPMTHTQIENLCQTLGGATQTEVIRRAVALLHHYGSEVTASKNDANLESLVVQVPVAAFRSLLHVARFVRAQDASVHSNSVQLPGGVTRAALGALSELGITKDHAHPCELS